LLPRISRSELPKRIVNVLVSSAPLATTSCGPQVAKIMEAGLRATLLSGGQLRTPTRIPRESAQMDQRKLLSPLPGGGRVGGVHGRIPWPSRGEWIGKYYQRYFHILSSSQLQPVGGPAIRISQGITSGLRCAKWKPSYPVIARAARIQGDVVL